jgi:hypothetical protein
MTDPNPAAPLTEAELDELRKDIEAIRRAHGRPNEDVVRILATLDAARATSTPAGHEANAYLDGDEVRCRECRQPLRVVHQHQNEGDCYGH